jgi:hypothetical protein
MALRKSTKLHKIKKVKSIIKEDISKVDKKYKTTYKDIKMYFTIKQLRHKTEKIYGQVLTYDWDRTGAREYQLHMIPYYKNKKDFACTLAHEMVHLYQMANEGDTGNHNQLFYSYRSKLNKIGLDL